MILQSTTSSLYINLFATVIQLQQTQMAVVEKLHCFFGLVIEFWRYQVPEDAVDIIVKRNIFYNLKL